MRLFPLTALTVSVLCLNACTTPAPQPPTAAPSGAIAWRRSIHEKVSGMTDVTSTAGAGIPVLGSPALAREWGAPAISKCTDGSFRLRYMKNGQLYGLICFSLTSPVANPESAPAWVEEAYDPQGQSPTVEHPQAWRQASVAGHAVRWFQVDGGGGADFPTFSTECFPHTDAAGRTAYYIVHAWSDTPDKAAALLRKAAFLQTK